MVQNYLQRHIYVLISAIPRNIAKLLGSLSIWEINHETCLAWRHSLCGCERNAILQSDWPLKVPTFSPKNIGNFFSVEVNLQQWPAIALTEKKLGETVLAIQQREELGKAEVVMEAALDESIEQDHLLYDQILKLQTQGNEIAEELGDRDSDNESWDTKDDHKRNRIRQLREQESEAMMLRLHLERERAVWRLALLQRYRDAAITQKEVDQDLVSYLKSRDLLPFKSEAFLALWDRLPARYRQERHLQKRFEEYKATFERRGLGGCYSHDELMSLCTGGQQSRIDAFCNYEDAKLDVAIAEKEMKRYKVDITAMEQGYRTAFLSGKDVPSPSEFARDCVTQQGKLVHALAEARARFARVTKHVELWDHISELNSDAMVDSEPVSDASMASSSASPATPGDSQSSASLVGPNGRKHAMLGDPRVGFIGKWRRGVPQCDELESPSISRHSDRCSGRRSESVDMEDSKTVYEQRRYQRVRGKQWYNKQRAKDEGLLAHSRTKVIKIPEVDAQAEQHRISSRSRRAGMQRRLEWKRQRQIEDLDRISEDDGRSSATNGHPSKRQKLEGNSDDSSSLSGNQDGSLRSGSFLADGGPR